MFFKSCLELSICLSGVDKQAVLALYLVHNKALVFLAFLFICVSIQDFTEVEFAFQHYA